MFFKQFYLNCLAHASYLIGSDGEAVVVDPQRDVDQYIDEAAAHKLAIKFVIETHLHADFVSGHRELAARAGAEIVFGEKAGVAFAHRAAKHGDELSAGRVKLRIMETPGHTPESICVLVTDTEVSDLPQKVLTGDTLFIGDVGRPDLAGGKGYTAQAMAALMYDSLHDKLLLMTTDLPEAPAYFSKDAEINRAGAPPLNGLSQPAALSPAEVRELGGQGQVILDVRTATDFGAGHVPGALNIGLGGQFASWAGSLIPMTSPIVIIADSVDQVEEAQLRLARVGIERVKGYLSRGILAWSQAGLEVASVPQITVSELKQMIPRESDLQIIDVRRPAEYQSGHAPRAVTAPLSILKERAPALGLDRTKPTAVICAGGYRSSAATSIMQQAGFTNVMNVTGGTSAWINAGYEVETPA